MKSKLSQQYKLQRWTIGNVTKGKEGDTFNDSYIVGWGNVFGNPEFYPGRMMRTSLIEKLTLEDDCVIMTTQNSIYRCALADCFVEDYETKEFLCKYFPKQTVRFEEMFQGAVPLASEPSLWIRDHFARGDIFVPIEKEKVLHESIANQTYIFCVHTKAKYRYAGLFIKNECGILEDLSIDLHTAEKKFDLYEKLISFVDLERGFDFQYSSGYYRWFDGICFRGIKKIQVTSKVCPKGYGLAVLNVGADDVRVEDILLCNGDVHQYGNDSLNAKTENVRADSDEQKLGYQRRTKKESRDLLQMTELWNQNQNQHEAIANNTYIVCIDSASMNYGVGTLFKDENGEIKDPNFRLHHHQGMFQDSVLCRSENNEFDFRYFPYLTSIASYVVNYPEKYNLVVYNAGESAVQVEDIVLRSGEIYSYISKNL